FFVIGGALLWRTDLKAGVEAAGNTPPPHLGPFVFRGRGLTTILGATGDKGTERACEVLVLHGVWDADTLAIWGEVAPRAGARSGVQKTSGGGNHHFSAGLDTLRRSMIEACSTEAADRAEPGELVLVLPGDTTAPAASTTAHTDTEPAGFHPWRVPALRLPAADAERLLARLDHVRAGPALMHLASVRAFAEHLV